MDHPTRSGDFPPLAGILLAAVLGTWGWAIAIAWAVWGATAAGTVALVPWPLFLAIVAFAKVARRSRRG